jgi:hypothetical protein
MKNIRASLPTTIAILFAIAAFYTAPQAHAYYATAQKAVDLGNGSALFFIEYRFGMEKYEVHLPALAHHTTNATNDSVSYQILDSSGDVTKGTTTGVVVSSAKLNEKAMYVIEKGVAKKLTLAVLFTPAAHKDGEQYRLQVSYLPFQFNGTQQLQLNPSELTYYTTKLISL